MNAYSVLNEESFNRVTLFLPSRLLQVLRDEHLAAEAAKKAQEAEEQRQLTNSEDLRPVTPFKPRPAYGVTEFDLVAEAEALTGTETCANCGRSRRR